MVEGKVTYTGVAASAAAILAALSLAKKAEASTGVIPPEIIELLAAMAADISDMDVNLLPKILAALSGSSSGRGYAANLDYPYTSSTAFAAALAPVRLPYVEIDDDYSLVIKAFNGNPPLSYIYVAKSGPDAININASWPLAPGETISYRVHNAEEIWIAASVAPGCSAYWTVEQRRS